MVAIADFFRQQKLIFRQRKELGELRAEVEKLHQQNDSMRQGMRRCTSCEYRIDFKARQDAGGNP